MAGMARFDGVWKKFRRGERHDSLRDLIPSVVGGLLGRRRPDARAPEEFWALRDISFEVSPGEALGIIGPNGAGKSTVLKLLTKIVRPNRGRCDVRGRVGALIEIAAAFHPDLTGRENIYLQGAIMGMKRSEISAKLDSIVDFAGVSEFIDTPVKRYSSGMNARLGFSVAAHLDPQVLLIDEVLSVGDRAFQERCVARMSEFKRQGVAIVFVSHHLPAVNALCDRALLLMKGTAAFGGPVGEATSRYLQASVAIGHSDGAAVEFANATLTNDAGEQVKACPPGTRLRLRVDAIFHEDLRDVTFGFVVHQGASGICAYGANTGSLGLRPCTARTGDRLALSFDFSANLTRGDYLLELHAAHAPTMTIHARRCPILFLRIDETVTPFGVADLAANCQIERAVPEACTA